MNMNMNLEAISKIAIGSLILGGGGGGDLHEGLNNAKKALAIGNVRVVPISSLSETQGVILTVSGVGSPASDAAYYSSDVYEILLKQIRDHVKDEIIGFIPCEMGASSSFEPFIPAALLNVPVIDSACDGRAHPFGIMGALGLEKEKNDTIQVGAGGKKSNGSYLEISLKGTIEKTSDLMRNAAASAGGAVAVIRNPVPVQWLQKAGATGAYQFAYEIGEAYVSATTPVTKAEAICKTCGGRIICQGTVAEYHLQTENALDQGYCLVMSEGHRYRIYFFNEYMALDRNEERIHTFPDLIVTLDAKNGNVLTSAEIKQGQEVVVIATSKKNMLLGRGLLYRDTYKRIEDTLGIQMTMYNEDIFLD